MKGNILITFFVLITITYGAEHYARVEPLNRYTIKSSVSGTIVWSDIKSEGTLVKSRVVVKIDSKIDKKELQTALKSKRILNESLKLSKELLPSLKENYLRQKRYFKRVSILETSSQTQKDSAFNAMLMAKDRFFSTKDRILNLQKSISDIKFKISMLKDKISKKSIKLRNRYLYKLFVKKGDYATFGMPLAIVDDLSKAKLTIYLSQKEIESLNKNKAQIYINGKKSNLKSSKIKIWKESDDKFISSYKTEIILEPKYRFSSLIKVEIK